jgi:signal transduction histidine kinase
MTCVLLLDVFVLAVHEVTGNAVQHGGGRGRARLWYADGALRCRVTDDGPGLTGGAGGAIVTLEFDLAVTRRDTPGLASAAAPGARARR